MKDNYDQIEHKNLELLRYYLSKDIKHIDSKISSTDDGMVGYFFASLVDILVVVFFEDGVDQYLKKKYPDNTTIQIIWKFLFIVFLLVSFILVVKFVKWFLAERRNKRIAEGRSLYEGEEAETINQQWIDRFDNVACDGLIICRDYRERYFEETDQSIKNFYLYEIVHYLKKANGIFGIIIRHKELYVATGKMAGSDKLIAPYRINNFIDFSNDILQFLLKETKTINSKSLQKDLINLENSIHRWKKIED